MNTIVIRKPLKNKLLDRFHFESRSVEIVFDSEILLRNMK